MASINPWWGIYPEPEQVSTISSTTEELFDSLFGGHKICPVCGGCTLCGCDCFNAS